MDKLISQLNPSGADLQDVDQIEGQKSAELEGKRFTGLQVRAVEKAEREAQDDVIEANVGLDVNGIYQPEADSWVLRAADFAAGTIDRGGATGALDETVQNALRLLDGLINALPVSTYVVTKTNIAADTTWTDVIPAGYCLEYIVFSELNGTSPILDLGITVGGNEVFINQEMVSSGLTTVSLFRMFSLVNPTTLYINDDDAGSNWNGTNLNIYLVLRKIL